MIVLRGPQTVFYICMCLCVGTWTAATINLETQAAGNWAYVHRLGWTTSSLGILAIGNRAWVPRLEYQTTNIVEVRRFAAGLEYPGLGAQQLAYVPNRRRRVEIPELGLLTGSR